MKKRSKKARSDAAKRGWQTRRKREREAAERKRKRRERDARRRRDRRGGGGVTPPPPKDVAPPDDGGYDEPLDDLADEWEIGFEYHSGGFANRHSFVDVNFRLAREDGEPFSEREARRVLAEFQETLLETGNPEIPAGYMMAGIDWHRPRWGTTWRTGDDTDFGAFTNVMRVEADNPHAWDVRLGSVKS